MLVGAVAVEEAGCRLPQWRADRVGRIGATRILYVVGAPQSQHLEMCFAVARMAGWLDGDGEGGDETVRTEHVAFGSVLGADRRMLRTRSGASVRLVDLLEEGVTRARAALAERDADLAEDERAVIARALGIGAVKYADLSTDRTKDYVFDWDRMLAFEGDTGPYLQYAHARVRSIFRRGGVPVPPPGTPVRPDQPEERALALALLGFGEAVRASAALSAPSKLCSYLFGLATAFTTFYERCPVLRAPDEATRLSRLVMADVTARVLDRGLGLLGMEAPARM